MISITRDVQPVQILAMTVGDKEIFHSCCRCECIDIVGADVGEDGFLRVVPAPNSLGLPTGRLVRNAYYCAEHLPTTKPGETA